MRIFGFLVSAIITGALVYALNTRFGNIPPIGKFLDPFQGVWQNAEARPAQGAEALLEVPGLKGRVTVVYDDKLVPHIFAENDDDLYFAQGYVTAQHRLWQMEFQTHAAAGRVSEIVGETALDFDRTNRRKGMSFAAERAVEAMKAHPEGAKLLDAYSAGVNAYIASLTPKTLPLEYKLLDYQPEPWTPTKSALLLKYMANTLAIGEADMEFTNALKMFGRKTFDILFPDAYPNQTPIVPTPHKKWDFKPVAIDTPKVQFSPDFIHVAPVTKPDQGVGSNNWAVSGKKTARGYPILCDDPHLTLSLPSIWFELQLHAPGVNVYGVSLPGAPAVIIGFNDSIAWGVTNAQRDLVDWYKIQFKDGKRNEYLLDGQWQPTQKRIEEIKVRGKAVYYDTVCYTNWGPVMYDATFHESSQKADYAMRWLAHDPSQELVTFYKLNRAKNYKDFVSALTFYDCPAQNFVFAATNGDIAMHIQGKYPAKWREQGKFLMDGTSSAMRWQNYIPDEQNVHVLNPQRGYVSSANQHPADSIYPYYVHASHYEHWRNRRINHLLDSMKGIRPEDMMKMQSDNFNLKAAESLPYLLAQLNDQKMLPEERRVFDLLAQWNFYNNPEQEAPSYYEALWDKLIPLVWDEMRNGDIPMKTPEDWNTIRLMKQRPDWEFMDIKNTPEKKETAKDLIAMAFKQAVDSVATWKVKNSGQKPEWAQYKATSIQHLARIMPFSVPKVLNGGNHGIVNATSERNGPSWRMVVELDPKGVRGWGVYPGGQSGNPGSPYYTSMVDTWKEGQHYPLLFMHSPKDGGERLLYKQILQ